eukprot:5705762-Pyramimonas_sp.AAC.1
MVEGYLDRLHQLERHRRSRVARDRGPQVETVPLVQEWEDTLKETSSAENRKWAGLLASCRKAATPRGHQLDNGWV